VPVIDCNAALSSVARDELARRRLLGYCALLAPIFQNTSAQRLSSLLMPALMHVDLPALRDTCQTLNARIPKPTRARAWCARTPYKARRSWYAPARRGARIGAVPGGRVCSRRAGPEVVRAQVTGRCGKYYRGGICWKHIRLHVRLERARNLLDSCGHARRTSADALPVFPRA
jgi:hypothetical protein